MDNYFIYVKLIPAVAVWCAAIVLYNVWDLLPLAYSVQSALFLFFFSMIWFPVFRFVVGFFMLGLVQGSRRRW